MNLHKIEWLQDICAPAPEEKIELIEKLMGLTIPDVYQEFLRQSDGATTKYLTFYEVEALPEQNTTYEVQQYAPGYLSIGCGNGYQLLMQAQPQAREVRLVDDGTMQISDHNGVIPDLEEWLEAFDEDPGDLYS